MEDSAAKKQNKMSSFRIVYTLKKKKKQNKSKKKIPVEFNMHNFHKYT